MRPPHQFYARMGHSILSMKYITSWIENRLPT
jgi:hypothetical protein